MVTSIADVGDVSQSSASNFDALLVGYTSRTVSNVTGPISKCTILIDYQEAVAQYNKAWNAAIRRYGWARTSLVPPSAWLPEADVKSDLGNF